MSGFNALALMSGLADGYVRGKQLRQDIDAREEDRALRRERNDRERAENARQDKLREDLAAASAPQKVTGGETYQPAVDDNGLPMPANPTAGNAWMVGTQSYTDRAAADAAAAAANAPQAQTQRMAQAYMANGMPAQAQQLTTAARQGEAADLQLAHTKDTMERDKALREASSLLAKGGWQAVPTLHERYNDGLTSKVQEDGKGGATVTLFDKAGKQVGAPEVYADLPEFYSRVAGQFDPSLWLSDSRERRKEDRAQSNADRSYALQEKQFDLAGKREARMAASAERTASAAERQARLAEEAAKPKVETPDSTFDSKTAAEIAKAIAIKEAEGAAGEGGAPMTAPAIAQRTNDIVEQMRRDHTNRFITQRVQTALNQAKADPAAYREAYSKATQLMPPEVLAGMGFKAPEQAGPAASPPAAAAPAVARTAAPAPALRRPAAGRPARPARAP